MTSAEQNLYLPAVANSMCEEISLTPYTHIFISSGFTIFFFIIVPALIPGNHFLGLIITTLTLLWYMLCFIVDIYRDYMFYDRRPNYEVFARCLLNKEFNERLYLKVFVIGVLAQRFVACLMRLDVGALGISIFRFFVKALFLFGTPALVARGVAVLGASIGMGWPFIYLFIVASLFTANSAKIQMSPGYLYIAAAETYVTGGDEEGAIAATIMAAAEGALVSEGEDVPSNVEVPRDPTVEGAADNNDAEKAKTASSASSEDKHAKLNWFAARADRESILFRLLFVIGTAISVYICVVSWDWSYGQNDISYSKAWSALDIYRPTAKQLYDKRDTLTASQAAYIASLFC